MNPNDITDIKPPIDLPVIPWLWIIAACVMVIAIVVFVIIKRRGKVIVAPTEPQLMETPKAKALRLLQEIKVQGLIDQGRVKDYYDGISDIIRQLIEDVYAINATHMSSEEFFAYLVGNDKLAEQLQAVLLEMLSKADMVKFAKHLPSQDEVNGYWVLAMAIVEKVDGI